MRDLAFAIVWVVLFPVALWSAHIGVLLWIWVALLVPNQELYGFMAGIPFNKVVVFATVFAIFFGRDKKKFYVDSTVTLCVLFFLCATLSSIFADYQTDRIWSYYDKLSKELILAFCISGLMWSRHRIHMLLLVFCISIGFTSVIEGLEVFVTAGGHKIVSSGGLGDNNGIALVVLMTIPILYYLAQYSIQKYVKIVIFCVIPISIFAVIGSNSRGAFVGLLIIGVFFLWNTKNKFIGITVCVLAAVFVLLTAPESWVDRVSAMHSSVTETGENGSFMGRVVAWKISTLIALDNPLTGGGFDAVAQRAIWYHYVEHLSEVNFISTPELPPFPLVAHSIYFEVLGDLGFPGLFVFLSILGMSIFNCGRIRRQTRGRPELEWADDLARMLQISMVVYAVSGAALSFAYSETYWILVAVISRLNRTVQDALREASDTIPVQNITTTPPPAYIHAGAARANTSL